MTDLYRKFEKEKKALVPKRDYIDGHPFEEKVRRVCFKAGLKHQGHDAAQAFNNRLQLAIRTVVSKTYTDMFQATRFTSNELFSESEKEEHLDWLFEELEKYQQEAKELIKAHLKELSS